jgi:hypothetical protein
LRKRGGGPERGNAANTICRDEESPVASPRQNGEEADSASSGASWGRRPFTTWIAFSASSTATWMCSPKMSSRRAMYCIWSTRLR